MSVAGGVVIENLALDRILGHLQRELDRLLRSADNTPISSAVSARRASPSHISARKSRASSVAY